MDTQPNNEQPTQGQQTYRTPEIIDYGNIEALTQVGGGANTDLDGGSLLN